MPPGPVIERSRARRSRPTARKGVLEQAKLIFAADEWRLGQVRASVPAALRDDAQGPPGGHRAGLALEHLLAGRLERDGGGGGALRRLTDEDGAGGRDALQPRRRC